MVAGGAMLSTSGWLCAPRDSLILPNGTGGEFLVDVWVGDGALSSERAR